MFMLRLISAGSQEDILFATKEEAMSALAETSKLGMVFNPARELIAYN